MVAENERDSDDPLKPMTWEEFGESEFWNGFVWAKQMFRAMGYKIDDAIVIKNFRDLVNGNVTFWPTAEETIADMAKSGVPMTPEAIAFFKAISLGPERRKQDLKNMIRARQFLEAFGLGLHEEKDDGSEDQFE